MSDTQISDEAMYVDDRGYEVVNLHVSQGLEKMFRMSEAVAADTIKSQRQQIESLRALATKFELEAVYERVLRYEAEAERNAETERCAKIAREFQLSPGVGKTIAALIMEGR